MSRDIDLGAPANLLADLKVLKAAPSADGDCYFRSGDGAGHQSQSATALARTVFFTVRILRRSTREPDGTSVLLWIAMQVVVRSGLRPTCSFPLG